MSTKKPSPQYTAEFRARGVRLFREQRADYASDNAAYRAIASKLGCSHETLRAWCNQAARDAGERDGLTTAEKTRSEPSCAIGSSTMASELEREVKELRTANEILKKGEPMERQWSERHWRTPILRWRSSTARSASEGLNATGPREGPNAFIDEYREVFGVEPICRVSG